MYNVNTVDKIITYSKENKIFADLELARQYLGTMLDLTDINVWYYWVNIDLIGDIILHPCFGYNGNARGRAFLQLYLAKEFGLTTDEAFEWIHFQEHGSNAGYNTSEKDCNNAIEKLKDKNLRFSFIAETGEIIF